MQESENTRVVTLEYQLTERFGLLLSQTQLAELLGRTIASLRCSLNYSRYCQPIRRTSIIYYPGISIYHNSSDVDR